MMNMMTHAGVAKIGQASHSETNIMLGSSLTGSSQPPPITCLFITYNAFDCFNE